MLLHWHLEPHNPESWSVFAFVKILGYDVEEHVVNVHHQTVLGSTGAHFQSNVVASIRLFC
jgi:hypothetical protein